MNQIRLTYLLYLLVMISSISVAQTGPGGVGSSSDNILWLDATQLGLSENDAVSSWTDVSGNNNHALQATSGFQPIFKTSSISSQASIEFDGVDDLFQLTNHVTAGEISTFVVFDVNNSDINGLFSFQNHMSYTNNGNSTNAYDNARKYYSLSISNNTPTLTQMHTDAGSASGSLYQLTGNASSFKQRTQTRTGFLQGKTISTIGSLSDGSTSKRFLNGNIAEIVVFNRYVTTVERRLVNAYLGSKYGMLNFSYLFRYSNYPNEVFGIGAESDGSVTTSQGTGIVEVSNPSSLGNGDYLLIGHDAAGFTTNTSNLPSGYIERWSQVWRVQRKNSPGTVTLKFFLGTDGFSTDENDYVLLIDGNGDFSSGSTEHTTGLSYNMIENSITFTGVSLPNGQHFTLAEKDNSATAIADGDWTNVNSWACGCVPGSSDDVIIPSSFDIDITSSVNSQNLTIESGGSLSISGSNTLSVFEDFTINGSFNPGSGTLYSDMSLASTFSNASGSNIELFNLHVHGLNTLFLAGGWSLSNDLTVSEGTLDVSIADSLVLLSDASSTAQILESDGTFVGDFTLQRFISTRNAEFANISAPISNATVASIDDDLKLSGVGGNNGTATTTNKKDIFYSMYSYDRSNNNKVDTITSLATALVPGIGYEVYLYNTLTTMNDTVIDYVGTPNFGNIQAANLLNGTPMNGFNLIGNPYQSFISFDNTDQPNISATFYIYETNLGNYAPYSNGDVIAPGQGFWVENTSGIPVIFNFEEEDKISSNSSTFLRQKKSPAFSLELSNNVNYFKNSVQIAFDYSATEGIDQFDAKHLPSPHKESSEIYSKTVYSDKLIKNTLNQFEESHVIPLELKIGEAGSYQIESNNLNSLLENYSCVYLNDNEKNENIDLSISSNYSFDAESGISNRFNLILSNSFEDCEAKLNEESLNQKIDSKLNLRESYGAWFLDYKLGNENQLFKISVYSLNGQQVIPTNEISLTENGTYQLSGLNNLEGIFVIQIIGQEEIINKTVKL